MQRRKGANGGKRDDVNKFPPFGSITIIITHLLSGRYVRGKFQGTKRGERKKKGEKLRKKWKGEQKRRSEPSISCLPFEFLRLITTRGRSFFREIFSEKEEGSRRKGEKKKEKERNKEERAWCPNLPIYTQPGHVIVTTPPGLACLRIAKASTRIKRDKEEEGGEERKKGEREKEEEEGEKRESFRRPSASRFGECGCAPPGSGYHFPTVPPGPPRDGLPG